MKHLSEKKPLREHKGLGDQTCPQCETEDVVKWYPNLSIDRGNRTIDVGKFQCILCGWKTETKEIMLDFGVKAKKQEDISGKKPCPHGWIPSKRTYEIVRDGDVLMVHDDGSCGHPPLADSCPLRAKYQCEHPAYRVPPEYVEWRGYVVGIGSIPKLEIETNK